MEFGFVNFNELLEILKICIFYVYVVNVESEVIVCLEVISVGIVFVIVNSFLSVIR